jgi:hypothetical protein
VIYVDGWEWIWNGEEMIEVFDYGHVLITDSAFAIASDEFTGHQLFNMFNDFIYAKRYIDATNDNVPFSKLYLTFGYKDQFIRDGYAGFVWENELIAGDIITVTDQKFIYEHDIEGKVDPADDSSLDCEINKDEIRIRPFGNPMLLLGQFSGQISVRRYLQPDGTSDRQIDVLPNPEVTGDHVQWIWSENLIVGDVVSLCQSNTWTYNADDGWSQIELDGDDVIVEVRQKTFTISQGNPQNYQGYGDQIYAKRKLTSAESEIIVQLT